MGGSAIGADLLNAFAVPHLRVPVLIHRNYDLPGWASGPETLVIASSHSGDTEETLSAFERGRSSGCRLMALSTGGKLGQAARDAGLPAWEYAHKGQPRGGVLFRAAPGCLRPAGIDPIPGGRTGRGHQAMRAQAAWRHRSLVNNPAKRMASIRAHSDRDGREQTFWSPSPAAGRPEINEIAKAWAQFEALPGSRPQHPGRFSQSPDNLAQVMALFLPLQPPQPAAHRPDQNHLDAGGTEHGFHRCCRERQAGSPVDALHFGITPPTIWRWHTASIRRRSNTWPI
jgi:glucose/mannose-6-phosphate isomerase